MSCHPELNQYIQDTLHCVKPLLEKVRTPGPQPTLPPVPLHAPGWGTQGNRLSCRDQEGRRGSEEAVPGPSVFPSGEPGVSGDFWVLLWWLLL